MQAKPYMKKTVLIFLLFLFTNKLFSQSFSLDKNKVMDFFQQQQYDDAADYLAAFYQSDSGNIQLLQYLGYAYYMNDKYDDAEKYFQKIFLLDSNNITAIQYLASIYKGKKGDETLFFANRLVRLRPAKASYSRQLAEVFQKMGKKDSALFYFNLAYQLSPGDAKNALGLGWALIDEKGFGRIDSIAKPFLAKDSMNISFLKLLIASAYDSKHYENAIAPGERLMQQGDISIGSLTRVIHCCYNLKLYKECIHVCDYMDSSEIADEQVYYYEAMSKAKLKDYINSNELLRTCLSLAISKKAEIYYYGLSENYQALKQLKKALADYDTAYYLFKSPMILYYCGYISEMSTHNKSMAKKYYQKYLRVAKPETAEEKKAFAYVKEKLTGRKKEKAKK